MWAVARPGLNTDSVDVSLPGTSFALGAGGEGTRGFGGGAHCEFQKSTEKWRQWWEYRDFINP